MKQVYDFNELQELERTWLFLDANTILFRFWKKFTNNTRAADYADLFDLLVKDDYMLVVNFNVFSEVINKVEKEEWVIWKGWRTLRGYNHHNSIKDFRDSREGIKIMEKVNQTLINDVLPYVEIAGKIFNTQELAKLLKYDGLDFNDKEIVTICKEKNFAVVTDDFDFYNRNIPVLTCNPRFFGKKKIIEKNNPEQIRGK
jgi:predicted nucleic acid-binding protein